MPLEPIHRQRLANVAESSSSIVQGPWLLAAQALLADTESLPALQVRLGDVHGQTSDGAPRRGTHHRSTGPSKGPPSPRCDLPSACFHPSLLPSWHCSTDWKVNDPPHHIYAQDGEGGMVLLLNQRPKILNHIHADEGMGGLGLRIQRHHPRERPAGDDARWHPCIILFRV